MKKVLSILILVCFSYLSANAQIAKCKGKYLGNIIGGSVPSNYTSLWNQATSENGCKWGSVEGTQGTFNFTTGDIAYNWAKNNNALFKYHNFVWGSQTPSWVSSASVATIQAEVANYIQAVYNHYSTMGGIQLIDVVNEPVNTALSANYKAALTAGYQSEAANAGDLNNTYGWAIWPYQLARKYFPNATLLINEYNVEMNWNSCRASYETIINAIKNAPNLTDGKKNLIDGIGLQCHGIDNLTAANFKACIDELWNTCGLPVHITEFDQAATTEAIQQTVFSTLIPVAWTHPHVAGITLWGYIQGTTWINGNGTAGPSGTDSGLEYSTSYSSPLGDRPAMTWLKSYFSGLTSLACCPAPAPFGACASGPAVTITSPTSNATYGAPASSISLTATATTTNTSISKVVFYNGTTVIGTATASPYTVTWTNVTAGTYSITAVVTDNTSATATSAAITINVVNTYKIYKTPTPITVDGTADLVWSNASVVAVSATKLLSGTVTNSADLSGTCKFLWDNTNLYVLANITDDVLIQDSQTAYDNDGVEIYVDINDDKGATYDSTDVQYTFEWNNGTTVATLPTGRLTTGIKYAAVSVTGGYVVEASIPWTTLKGTPAVNQLIGIDFMINDADDNSGNRQGKLSWNASADSAWTDPNYMGNGQLMDVLSCTPPAAPTVTAAISYCQNATASALTATGTGLLWYSVATGGTGTATAPTPSTAATGSTTYYVSQTVSSCESNRSSITVTVNAKPTISAGAAVSICSGTSTILTATGGASYNWSNSVTTSSNTVSPTATTTYSVTGTNANGCSATSSVVVTVNTTPAAPTVTSPVNYTQGATATALTATGTSLKWYTTATGGTALTSAPVPTTTVTGTTNYYVSQTVNTCESPRANIAVIISAISQTVSLKVGWNIIGCPISGTTSLQSALSSIWSNVQTVKNLDSFYSSANPPAMNSLTTVKWGQGYLVYITAPCTLDWIAR